MDLEMMKMMIKEAMDKELASLSSLSSSSSAEPRHLQEHLELCGDMFDSFYNEAQQFIDKAKEKSNE